MGRRRKARELVLQALYAFEISGEDMEKILGDIFDRQKPSSDIVEFTTALATKTIQHLAEIDQIIAQKVQRWELSRIAVVDKNILRLALFEILIDNKVPVKVAINEAVELAKRFGSSKSSKFVNGVLGAVSTFVSK